MSTGLTWVALYDYENDTIPFSASWVQSFSSYEEAVEFAKYNSECIYTNIVGGNAGLVYIIWTSSPNSNGYVLASSVPAVFVPWD